MALPKLRSPIVLVHGLLGFGEVRLRGVTVSEYFPDVSRALRAAGNRVLIPNLSPTGGVADRAAQLKEFIDRESPQEPVHLLAHSMGGLDSRYLLSRLDMARRVLTLTTRTLPVCSRTNSRPSGANSIAVGAVMPLAKVTSLKPAGRLVGVRRSSRVSRHGRKRRANE